MLVAMLLVASPVHDGALDDAEPAEHGGRHEGLQHHDRQLGPGNPRLVAQVEF